MLRTLKHAFQSPRLLGLKATTLSNTCTVNISKGDIHAATSSGAGLSSIVVGDAFNRAPIVVGSPFSSIGSSPIFHITADPTTDTLALRTSAGSTATDGPFNALVLGYDAQDADYLEFCPFHVRNAWNSVRLELFKVTPHATTPVINIGSQKATLTRNGTGDYTLTFKRAFSSDNVIAVGTAYSDTAARFAVVSTSATAVRVEVSVSGVASDAKPFYLVVQGSDNPEIGSRQRKATKVSDLKPRLIAGHISYSGGTPSIVKGTGDFTIEDTTTGSCAVTFTKPFLREPITIVSKDSTGMMTAGTVLDSLTNANLLSFNNSEAAADPGDIHFMTFGYDHVDECRFI